MPRKVSTLKSPLAAKLKSRRPKPAVKNQKKLQREESGAIGSDRLSQIFYVASQLFCEQGYDATSMTDIGDAVGVTKAAIYHFVPGGKQDLLFAIINYGMDTVQEAVVKPTVNIEDAEERLRAIFMNHAKLVMSGSTTEGFNPVTVQVDEVSNLSPTQRRKIDQRKRDYMNYVRATLEQLKKEGKLKDLDITVTAFSLMGMIIWLGHWYRPDGRLTSDQVAETICQVMLGGILRSPLPSGKA